VAKAILDPRHDILFQLTPTLLAPSFFFRQSHRRKDTSDEQSRERMLGIETRVLDLAPLEIVGARLEQLQEGHFFLLSRERSAAAV
jgi:hypothetical protein